MRAPLQIGDVIRFGRVTFKVTELVLTKEQIEKVKQTLEQVQNGVFKVQA